jgi:hypothetical protein
MRNIYDGYRNFAVGNFSDDEKWIPWSFPLKNEDR